MTAVYLAWATVALYPMGLLLLAAVLLGYHREILVGDAKSTKLCRAIEFL